MLQDTEISSKTGSPVLPRLTLLYSWSQQTEVVSKLPSKRVTTRKVKSKVKPDSMLVYFIYLVLNKLSLVSTRWTINLLVTPKTDTKKSNPKSPKCLPRLVSKPRRSHSFLCPDGKEITCAKLPITCLGTLDF